MPMEASKKGAHIVLVHGACHGAWCWYKVKPLLEAAGHRVTAVDLAASGVDSRNLKDLRTFSDYTQPLLEVMAALPPQEKVVLVGHSLGGMNLGLAMDSYPDKISIAVFVAAFMPDAVHTPSYVLQTKFEYNNRSPAEAWLDTEFSTFGTPDDPRTSMLFGPKFLSEKIYNLCSPEDLTLAKSLMRPSSAFIEDLSKKSPFSDERFGSVKRVYVVCKEDKGMTLDFQRWLIETIGVEKVKEIENADHMPMLCTPRELCRVLLEIANN